MNISNQNWSFHWSSPTSFSSKCCRVGFLVHHVISAWETQPYCKVAGSLGREHSASSRDVWFKFTFKLLPRYQQGAGCCLGLLPNFQFSCHAASKVSFLWGLSAHPWVGCNLEPLHWSGIWVAQTCGPGAISRVPSALGFPWGPLPGRIWDSTTRLLGKPQAQGMLRLVALFFSTLAGSDVEGQKQPETRVFVGWKKHSYPAFILSSSLPFFWNNTLKIHYIAI